VAAEGGGVFLVPGLVVLDVLDQQGLLRVAVGQQVGIGRGAAGAERGEQV